MPPKKKADPQAPSSPKELKELLWKAADKLRGSMDASQYKDVVLGLIFLKYVSDAFNERRAELRAEYTGYGLDDERLAEQLDDIDEYTANNVFFLPPNARWAYLSANAKGLPARSIGQLVDDAFELIDGANPGLKGATPRGYNRDAVDQRRLGELIDLLNNARFSGQGAARARDLLGEVYEYFLEKFARAEGKRGGEFFTPASVVRTLVEVLEPTQGRIYDPACGSGGMFVQAEKFLAAHDRDRTALSIFGQELNAGTWRLARMNLAIHGLNGNLSSVWGDTFAHDQHAGVEMDYALSNPPFNIKVWHRREDDRRWRYGVPPVNNANYAWIQHILSKLKPDGSAGVVMANGSMASNSGGEGEIRAQIVESDLVSCMVALPTQLFRSTGIPVCIWFFAKDKTAGPKGLTDRTGQVLFIDARNMGHMVDRAERELSDGDITTIADTFHSWRRTASAVAKGRTYEDVPGFCKSVTLADIKAGDYSLTPGRYVGAAEEDDDSEPMDEKVSRLTSDLLARFDESVRLDAVVREHLRRLA